MPPLLPLPLTSPAHQDLAYSAELVLATLMEPQAQHYVSAPQQDAAGAAQQRSTSVGTTALMRPPPHQQASEAQGAATSVTPAPGLRGPAPHGLATAAGPPPSTAPHVPGDTPWTHRPGERGAGCCLAGFIARLLRAHAVRHGPSALL